MSQSIADLWRYIYLLSILLCLVFFPNFVHVNMCNGDRVMASQPNFNMAAAAILDLVLN